MGRKQRETPQLTEAIRLLRTLLADGPQLACDCVAWLTAAGISEATIARARRELGVITLGNNGRRSQAVWTLDSTRHSFPRRVTGSAYRPRISTLATDRIGIDCLRFSSPPLADSLAPSPDTMRMAFMRCLQGTFDCTFSDRAGWTHVERWHHRFRLQCKPWHEPIDTIGGVRIEYGIQTRRRELFQVFVYAAHQVLLDLDEVDALLTEVQSVAMRWFPHVDTSRFFHPIYCEATYDVPLTWVRDNEVLHHIHKANRPMQLHWSPFYARVGSRDGDFDIAYPKFEDGLGWWRFESKKRRRTLEKLGIHHARDLRTHIGSLFDASLPPPLDQRVCTRIREYQRGQNVRQQPWLVPSNEVPVLTNVNRHRPGWNAQAEAVRGEIIEAVNEAERVRMTTSSAPQPPIFTNIERWQYLGPSPTLPQVYATADPSAVDITNVRAVRAHFAAILPPLHSAFLSREGYDEWPTIVAVFDAAVQAGNTWAQSKRNAAMAGRQLQDYQQLVDAVLRMTTPVAAASATTCATAAAAGANMPFTIAGNAHAPVTIGTGDYGPLQQSSS